MKKILLLEVDNNLIDSIKHTAAQNDMLLIVRQFTKCGAILQYLDKYHTDLLLFNHDYLSRDLTEIIKIQRRFSLLRILIYYNPSKDQHNQLIAWDYSLFTYMGEYQLSDLQSALQKPNGMYLMGVS